MFATLIGLAFYLIMPTAPPRLVQGGDTDILSLLSRVGWWGADASAPKGLGQITNELAAFPSLHAGWALWVAIVLIRAGVPRFVQIAGLVYAAITMMVIAGTSTHGVIDAVVGWIVVLVAFGFVTAWDRQSAPVDDVTDGAEAQVGGTLSQPPTGTRCGSLSLMGQPGCSPSRAWRSLRLAMVLSSHATRARSSSVRILRGLP